MVHGSLPWFIDFSERVTVFGCGKLQEFYQCPSATTKGEEGEAQLHPARMKHAGTTRGELQRELVLAGNK